MRRISRELDPKTSTSRLGGLTPEDSSRIAQHRQVDGDVLRGDLEWIVMKCLEKDRMRRYATAKDLSTDIERHLNNEPVKARPHSTPYRFQKLVRRKEAVFTCVAAVITAICAVGLFAVWFSQHRARSQWAREEFLPRLREKADSLNMKVLLDVVSHFSRANHAYTYSLPVYIVDGSGKLTRRAGWDGLPDEWFDGFRVNVRDHDNIEILSELYKELAGMGFGVRIDVGHGFEGRLRRAAQSTNKTMNETAIC